MLYSIKIFDHNIFIRELENDIKQEDVKPLVVFTFLGKKIDLLTKINQTIEDINKNIGGEKMPLIQSHQLDSLCCSKKAPKKVEFMKQYIVIHRKNIGESKIIENESSSESASDEETNVDNIKRENQELKMKLQRVESEIKEIQEKFKGIFTLTHKT